MDVGWTGLAPTTAWGVFTRLLGLTYLIALAPLYHQILLLAGSRGITPVAELLDRIRADYPLPRRLLYFPSLLWLSSSDRFLRALPLVGSCAALLVIYGGPYAGWALLVCWVIYLSLDLAIETFYPWDCALFEAGFLALFLGPTENLPSLDAAPPLPVVALAFNLLLIRILCGFGKYKFIGLTRKDLGCLKAFLVYQPFPTRLGWYAYHLPGVFHRLGLLLLFLAEVPLPPLTLLSGPIRLLAAGGIAGLMAAIQLTGNFGFFNLIVVALCVPMLNLQSPVAALSLDQLGSSWSAGLVHLIMAVIFLGGLLYFPFNSWSTRAWPYWPVTREAGLRPLRWLLDFYRLLVPFRVVHAYGVFPSQSVPGLKFIPVLEASLDGQTWREYEYRFMASMERSPPRLIAPYMPRWDHSIFYEGYGVNTAMFLSSTLAGLYNPYHFSRRPPLVRAMQRLAEPDSPVQALFGGDPFADQARPRWLRARLYALEPTSPAERRRTGCWWRRHLIGTHLPPFETRAWDPHDWLNGPELFHWDAVIWRRRAPAMARFERAARRARSLEAIEAAAAATLAVPLSTVDRFWRDFIPLVQPPAQAGDWCKLAEVVEAARERFDTAARRDFERLAGLLAIALAARLEELIFGDPAARLPLPSYFHVGMLLHRLILEGRDALARALDDAEFVERAARYLTPAGGLWLWGVFRFETLMYHARSANLTINFPLVDWQAGLPGFILLIPFLVEQVTDGDCGHSIALSRSIADGEWVMSRVPS